MIVARVLVGPHIRSIHDLCTIVKIESKVYWTKKKRTLLSTGNLIIVKTAQRNCLVWVKLATCCESSFAQQKFIVAFCSVQQTVKCSQVNNGCDKPWHLHNNWWPTVINWSPPYNNRGPSILSGGLHIITGDHHSLYGGLEIVNGR